MGCECINNSNSTDLNTDTYRKISNYLYITTNHYHTPNNSSKSKIKSQKRKNNHPITINSKRTFTT
jgi:hypothetical protein